MDGMSDLGKKLAYDLGKEIRGDEGLSEEQLRFIGEYHMLLLSMQSIFEGFESLVMKLRADLTPDDLLLFDAATRILASSLKQVDYYGRAATGVECLCTDPNCEAKAMERGKPN